MDQYQIDFLKRFSYEVYDICRQADGARIARASMTEDQYYELLRILSKIHIDYKRETDLLDKQEDKL